MPRPILRVVDKAPSPRGWAVRAAEGHPPLAYAPTKEAAISLARAQIEASRNGGTLRIYFANGQLHRTSSFVGRPADDPAVSRRTIVSPNDLPARPSGDSVRKTIETLAAAGAQSPETVAALLRTIMGDDKLSVDSARTWVQLGPTARESLLSEVRSLLDSSPITAVAKFGDLLLSLQGLPPAASTLVAITQGIVGRDQKVIGKLDDLRGDLQRVEAKLDEHVLVTARSAIDHLLTAARTSGEILQSQQLQLAAGKFTELANLDPAAMTRGSSGEASNAALIVLGRWGKHIYFEMHGERRSALEEAYACASEYPLESVQRFDQSYFSEDYRTRTAKLLKALAPTVSQNRARQPISDTETKKADVLRRGGQRQPTNARTITAAAKLIAASGFDPILTATFLAKMTPAAKLIAASAFNPALTPPFVAWPESPIHTDPAQEQARQLGLLRKRIADEAAAKYRTLQALTDSDLQSLTGDAMQTSTRGLKRG